MDQSPDQLVEIRVDVFAFARPSRTDLKECSYSNEKSYCRSGTEDSESTKGEMSCTVHYRWRPPCRLYQVSAAFFVQVSVTRM